MRTCLTRHQWMLVFVTDSSAIGRYQELATHLTEALNFMRACGITPEVRIPRMRTTDFFTSHEALLLPYEQAFVRVDSTSGNWYCTCGAFPLDRRPHAAAGPCPCRVLRGIKNPIGLKCGPAAMPDELLKLLDMLNPATSRAA